MSLPRSLSSEEDERDLLSSSCASSSPVEVKEEKKAPEVPVSARSYVKNSARGSQPAARVLPNGKIDKQAVIAVEPDPTRDERSEADAV